MPNLWKKHTHLAAGGPSGIITESFDLQYVLYLLPGFCCIPLQESALKSSWRPWPKKRLGKAYSAEGFEKLVS
jgi:hypothetical protein